MTGYLRRRYPRANITAINAAIGGSAAGGCAGWAVQGAARAGGGRVIKYGDYEYSNGRIGCMTCTSKQCAALRPSRHATVPGL